MRLDDTIDLIALSEGYDENLDPVEIKKTISLGKCLITPNSSAQSIKTHDGKQYIYSYLILLRRARNKPIPRENDMIHICKKDGTIDSDCRVAGFVTLRNWIKIWA